MLLYIIIQSAKGLIQIHKFSIVSSFNTTHHQNKYILIESVVKFI